ncbi:MAG TPA: TlpA disulfide reductase family protein [Myxococcota bacterium]|jgi:peroxiredoxin
MSAQRLARWALGVALFAAAAWMISSAQREAPPIEVGIAAPEFALPRLAGGEIALRELRGKVVLVNFWATWCAPCEQEMPAMQRLYARLAPRGFELVAISEDDDPRAVARFQQRLGLTFPIALDANKRIAGSYQSFRYPESFLIDREGVLVQRYIGERDWDAPEYVARVERLLATPN